MRFKRRSILAIACAVALVVMGYVFMVMYGRGSAEVSVDLAGHQFTDDLLLVTLVATNAGHVPLAYHGLPPFREVRVRTDQGWTNIPQVYLSSRATIGILLPGRSLSYSISVPSQTQVFQVGCFFETVGARAWVHERMVELNWRHLYSKLSFALPWLPNGRYESVEFWSPEVEVKALQ